MSSERNGAHFAQLAAVDHHHTGGVFAHMHQDLRLVGHQQARSMRCVVHRRRFELGLHRFRAGLRQQIDVALDVVLLDRGHEQQARLTRAVQHLEVDDGVIDGQVRELALDIELQRLFDLGAIGQLDLVRAERTQARVERHHDVVDGSLGGLQRVSDDLRCRAHGIVTIARQFAARRCHDLVLLRTALKDDQLEALGANANATGSCHAVSPFSVRRLGTP